MHELSLCRSLLKIIEKKMTELHHPPKKQITAVFLEVSALCGVDVSMLEFYFAFVAKNTVAENARLHITTVPVSARCIVCKKDVSIQEFSPCPLCGNYRLIMAHKPELLVKSMEVS